MPTTPRENNNFDTLPAASILKKLDAACPGAGLETMRRARDIQEKTHAAERAAGVIPAKPFGTKVKDFFRSIAQGFNQSSMIYTPRYGAYGAGRITADQVDTYERVWVRDAHADMMRNDFGRVGDFIRAALREEMKARKLTPEKLGLTATEIADLNHCAAHTAAQSAPRP